MEKRKKKKKKKPEYKNVKVKPEIFKKLVRSKASLELKDGKLYSMGDVIEALLDSLPTASISLEWPGEETKEEG